MEEKISENPAPLPEQKNTPTKPYSWVVWGLLLIIILIAGFSYFSGGNENSQPESISPTLPALSEELPESTTATEFGAERAFEISGKPFEYSIKEIRVRRGDKVRINFSSTQGMHDWVLDEFNARTKILQDGQSDSVEFVADKLGSFEYYCSVPTHRQRGMVGTLIVE